MELIAAGAEHGAAFPAGVHFQEDVASVFVVFDWEALKKGCCRWGRKRSPVVFS
jgi:hypothetical protein